MIEEFFCYSCNFCDIESETTDDFEHHLNSVHFPGNCVEPQNVRKGGMTIVQQEEADHAQLETGNHHLADLLVPTTCPGPGFESEQLDSTLFPIRFQILCRARNR